MLTNLINHRINAFILNYKMSKVEKCIEKNAKKRCKEKQKFMEQIQNGGYPA